MTKIATKSFTKRQQAARARKQAKMDKMAAIAAIAFQPVQEVAFETNTWGYKTRTTPATPTDVSNFFKGRRAFGIEECFEELGMGHVSTFARNGWVVPYKPSINAKGNAQIYMITTKAAEHFNLPATLPGGLAARYVAA